MAAYPEAVTRVVRSPRGQEFLYRPLLPSDVTALGDFFTSLSPRTRQFSFPDICPGEAAEERCAAINRYDKLRLVALDRNEIVALIEFSFVLVESDRERYHLYGVMIDEEQTCRFGPCIRDAYQNEGLGTALMPDALEIARRFGKSQVILWGGVHSTNLRAIRFYEKNGFRFMGTFRDPDGMECYDMMVVL